MLQELDIADARCVSGFHIPVICKTPTMQGVYVPIYKPGTMVKGK